MCAVNYVTCRRSKVENAVGTLEHAAANVALRALPKIRCPGGQATVQ